MNNRIVEMNSCNIFISDTGRRTFFLSAFACFSTSSQVFMFYEIWFTGRDPVFNFAKDIGYDPEKVF